uniref:AAA+ ATPase domain-containing protein n=1 Tax=Biomphalaria glabrata TaxID=6526 RepID=A0A2C9KUW4_BIOGL
MESENKRRVPERRVKVQWRLVITDANPVTAAMYQGLASLVTQRSQELHPNLHECHNEKKHYVYYKETFSNFAHNALYRTPHPIQLPSAGHVFDYYLDEKTSEFANWSCRQQQDRIKNLAGFYVIPEVDRYSYLTEFLMSANIPILLAGAPGVGKTSFVQSMVLSKLPSTEVIMSNGLTSSILQDLILAHVSAIQNKNNPRPGGPSSSLLDQSKHLFFIDDLNMAPMIGDYQPPLELMRCLLSTGGMHDRNRKEFLKTKEASFIAATTIPSCPGSGLGKACHLISTRLTRHFVNLTVFSPSEDSLVTLFSKPLQTWLEEFPTFAVEHTYEFSKGSIPKPFP